MFEIHAQIGKGYYVWDDNSFNNDDLAFVKLIVLPVAFPAGTSNLIGQVYRSAGASFFIFFGSTAFDKTPDGVDLFALFFSVDQNNFFPWPTSQGSLRFPIAPESFPPVINVPGIGQVAQQVGSDRVPSTFQRQGLAWKLSLSEGDVQKLSNSATFASQFIPDPEVSAAVILSIEYIQQVDNLGRNKGVDISGILGTSTLIVTPRGTFNIMNVVQIVNGVAKFVVNQSSAAAQAAATTISNGIQQAGQAIAQTGNTVSNWIQNPF